MNKTPMVSICCITYNHEKYIRDAIEGFLMQKTTFPFEILIHDDASTDGAADIIREYENKYPHLLYPIYQKENQYSKGIKISPTFQYPRASGKYIAFCEGDDYWTDPYKLQKQVEFLEENIDYGLVHTDYIRFIEKYKRYNAKSNNNNWQIVNNNTYDSLLISCHISTLTVCLRTSILKQYLNDLKGQINNWQMGDYPLWLYYSVRSKIKYIPQKTAVYRILEESASFTKDNKKAYKFIQDSYSVRYYFINNYGCSCETYKKVKYNYYNHITLNKIKIAFEDRDKQGIRDAINIRIRNNLKVNYKDYCKLFFVSTKYLWNIGINLQYLYRLYVNITMNNPISIIYEKIYMISENKNQVFK